MLIVYALAVFGATHLLLDVWVIVMVWWWGVQSRAIVREENERLTTRSKLLP